MLQHDTRISTAHLAARAVKACIILCLGMLLAGCLQSKVPLSPLAALAPANPLVGDWIYEKQGETGTVHIGNEDGTAKLISVERDSDGTIKSEDFKFAATTIDGKNYMSVEIPDADTVLYILLQYRITDNKRLTLRAANIPFVADAIQRGLISGTANPKSVAPNAMLSADTDALQRFVTQYDKQLFTEDLVTYHRAH